MSQTSTHACRAAYVNGIAMLSASGPVPPGPR